MLDAFGKQESSVTGHLSKSFSERRIIGAKLKPQSVKKQQSPLSAGTGRRLAVSVTWTTFVVYCVQTQLQSGLVLCLQRALVTERLV